MTTIMVPIVWPISGGYRLLDRPPGYNDGYVELDAASADGSVIVGYYEVDRFDYDHPCRWDNGAFTPLTGPDVTNDFYPFAVSQNGNVVLAYGDPSYTVIRWTTPTNGTLIQPLPGYNVASTYEYADMMSDDGSIFVGISYNNSNGIAENTVWVNGVPTSFGLCSASQGCAMGIISGDGLTIAGGASQLVDGTSHRNPGYWRSGAFRSLTCNYNTSDVGTINYDGTIIYGYGSDVYGVVRNCYWDNLNSITGSTNLGFGVVSTYGTQHFLQCPGSSNAFGFAKGSGNTAFGYADGCAAKWVNGVFTNLQPTPYWSSAEDCSGNGTIVVGYSSESNNFQSACYWDAANVKHLLPGVTNQYGDGNSYIRISRDGTLIYGFDYVDEPAPSWNLIGGPTGGVGDIWADVLFVDFADSAVRAGFINPDNSWIYLGDYGELPTGTSPILFLTAQWDSDPNSILWGWGQDGGQDSWDVDSLGNNPTTGAPYADLAFDTCGVPANQLKLVSLYPFDDPTSDYKLVADTDFDNNFTQFSMAVWCCKDVHIQSDSSSSGFVPPISPPIVMDFSPSRIAITLYSPNGSLRFRGTWTVQSQRVEYQVLFSIDTMAQTYSLYVNDTVPIGVPTWGAAGSIGSP